MSFIDRIRGLFGGAPGDGSGGAGEMITCEEALSFIHEFLDGELPDAEYSRVRAHYDVCSRCYPHLQLEESFRAAVRRAAAGQEAPPELKARVLQLLKEAAGE